MSVDQHLERARQFHIRRENEDSAEENRWALSRVSCGKCGEGECYAPDCPHSLRVDPVEVPE